MRAQPVSAAFQEIRRAAFANRVNRAARGGYAPWRYLEGELATYVKDPKVTVQVVFTGSIRYYLLGQFTQPGLKYSDRPLRLSSSTTSS